MAHVNGLSCLCSYTVPFSVGALELQSDKNGRGDSFLTKRGSPWPVYICQMHTVPVSRVMAISQVPLPEALK